MLSSSGNLLAGATTRVAVGFAFNPFSVLKARYEVRKLSPRLHHTHFYDTRAFFSLCRVTSMRTVP